MEIENLNKSQIILLTLLTSFVTSIATGIVTVSLMDQAPPAIAQTVNRVVERTVEKVIPSAQTAAAGQTKTVVIKESDLIAQAIKQVRPSLVRVYTGDSEAPVFLGLGIVLTKFGLIVTDTRAIGEATNVVVEQSGGQRISATFSRRDSDNGLAYLTGATTSSDGKPALWTPAAFSNSEAALGQTIFALGGKTSTSVGDGIVSSIGESDHPYIDTSISAQIVSGSALIDMDGNVLGISTGVARDSSANTFIPSSLILLSPKIVPDKTDAGKTTPQ